MKLELANGKTFQTVDEEALVAALRTLDPRENDTAVLSDDRGGGFIQTALSANGCYVQSPDVESGNEVLYTSTSATLPLEQVTTMFVSYLRGTDEWKKAVSWETERLEGSAAGGANQGLSLIHI